ncbi:rho guanine nucleotide exchange factor 11 isoform X2 [Ahaetulla prasina]|uniref:rho guanine nucleotide exchange factor 11 isoform X2 n=1 Tax=Ahaetulla prasina TaxID=499056 RepID=UPI0026486CD7|nr:rho guanine nucleotide exchange factor 11 isoform X2 [Ahaetulla prasina]
MNMHPPALDRRASKRHPRLPRLGSLSSLGDSAPERRSPSHHRQPSDSGETTGLVQRCVIIQKDEHGFGFTVSGDRIVLVQSVRPGGAAMKAGVQEGDRIVKVNGTVVTNTSHLEVVKLIRSGAYVALTLLGSPPSSLGFLGLQHDRQQAGTPQITCTCPPPPPPPLPPPPHRVTAGPKPPQDPEVQKHATQILRKMLQQEEAELQRCYEVYSQNPASLLEEQIEGARRRVSQLQLKIRQEMGELVDAPRLPSDSSSFGSRLTDGGLSIDSQDRDSGLDSGTERFPSVSEISLNRNSVLSDPGLDSPHTSPVAASRLFMHHRRQGSDTPFSPSAEQSLDHMLRTSIIGPEEDYDPGYLDNENDSLFQDLGKLKMRPAHLGVFLRYIFSQADPSPLLLYLCVDVYQQMSPKEARALGKDIWHIFLDKTAPLRVKVSDQLLAEIDARLRNGEDAQSAFFEVQEAVMPEIQEQIQDYRTKRTMGLGSLYGENDLLELDGELQKERQVAEKQMAQLGDILSKYEDRSSPMSFALKTYMIHMGICPREARLASVVEKSQEKDKWLPFFPKTKKSSSGKKEKEATVEDKKRNPILKYIAKPKSSSQSTFHVPLSPVEVKPGNVRTIIQHFENSQNHDGQEAGLQRLSTGSFPEDLLDSDSSRAEVRLGRSESLKGREELRRLRKAENVPRSRSDVDMDAAAEAARLHQSASSSASSLSTRSLENPTPPYTPKTGRRSIESPSLGFSSEAFLPHLLEDELGQFSDLEMEPDSQNWQHTVGREAAAQLPQREIDRQEVINELFVTEASHLRTLRVLDLVFYQRLKREGHLSREELALLFPNLPELIEIHNSLSESMKKLREEGPVVKEVGDLMLSRFDGAALEEFQQVVAEFCAYQSMALELIRTKKRKETRFQLFMQDAESHPQCRRLQLKDLIISEMQRLTKYPLLLDSLIKHSSGQTADYRKLCRARDQCREALRYVNEAVKQAENQQRLESYQKRLDATSLERTSNPIAAEFKNLDLRGRRMIHEGPLVWRISKDKTVDLQVLLLGDLLVLLQRQDERLVLKCHSRTVLGSSDPKQTFSPVLRLGSILIRSVATDKRALFIICTSELGPQIYELVASTSLEKNTWMELLEEAVKSATQAATLPPQPHTQELCPHQPAPTSFIFPDAEIAPRLGQGSSPPARDAEEEEEEGVSDHTPTEAFADEQLEVGHPEEEEEEEEEGNLPTTPPLLPLEEAPPQRLPCLESMAESALGDVETLRRLLLHSFPPCQDSEPEDDLTPTPSGVGPSRHWGLTSASQEEALKGPHTSAVPGLPERDPQGHVPSSGPASDPGPGSGLEEVGPPVVQSGDQRSETPSCYLVVRKAEVEGSESARLLMAKDSQGGTDAGAPPNADGNTFYLSLPADSKEPQECAESVGEAVGALSWAPSLPPTVSLPGCQESTGETPARWLSPAEFSAPSQGMREADAIFRTIEQLTLKLTKLKDVEGAYRQLLLRQPPPKGHFTTEATPGQGSTSLPEPSRRSPSTHRGSGVSHPSLPSSPQSPVAAKPDVNGLPFALPEDGSQEVTL